MLQSAVNLDGVTIQVQILAVVRQAAGGGQLVANGNLVLTANLGLQIRT